MKKRKMNGKKMIGDVTSAAFSDGYIEKNTSGAHEGILTIERVDISPIEAQFFKKDGESYIWIKRKKALEYDEKSQIFKKREREPRWECYLKKQLDGDAVAYKGEFVFMRFRFSISAVWDGVLGMDKRNRLNLFVERMPMSQQTIINSINERKRKLQ